MGKVFQDMGGVDSSHEAACSEMVPIGVVMAPSLALGFRF